MQELVRRQQRAHLADGPPTAAVRRHRLDRLLQVVSGCAGELAAAMSSDFGSRALGISLMNDIVGSIPDIEYTRSHLARWMKPRRINRLMWPAVASRLNPDPLGVVGVIAPWNFPLNLAVVPAASALAAGNRVMIKMSEKTPQTASLFADLIADHFAPDELTVVTGGPAVGEQFSALPFDHLFFTGSPVTGRKVAATAAANLVPVTLELGGKNPAVVAPDADVDRAAERIIKARLSNGGQICLCPDYALVPAARATEFVDALVSAAQRAYPRQLGNESYCSLIDEDAFDRVVGLIEDARTHGAKVIEAAPADEQLPDRRSRTVAPTILTHVSADMRVDHEEVFGPVLTVYEYTSVSDAIAFINARPAPLGAYWYGPASSDFDTFVERTRAGGISRNDFALHATFSATPFGGVGASGWGSYHGRHGFDTFSHYKPVVGTDLPFGLTTSAATLGANGGNAILKMLGWHRAVVARRLR
jgi:coniferyl-aldehyde dehydrogenase